MHPVIIRLCTKIHLEKLLKIAGYDEFLDFLSLDKYKNKSTKDLKNIIQLYKLTILPKTTNIQNKIILITIFY